MSVPRQSVAIPTQWAVSGHGVPTVCAAHGQPAVRRTKTTFVDAIPQWMVVIAIFAFGIFVLVRMANRNTVTAPVWPFCAQCVATQRRRRLMALAAVTAGVLAFVAVAVDVVALPVVFLGGLAVLGAGLLLFVWASWHKVAGAQLSDDTCWIQVQNPHPAFAAQFAPFQPAVAEVATAIAPAATPRAPYSRVPTIAILVLIGGAVVVLFGVIATALGPSCANEKMVPGSVCRETNPRNGLTSVTTYERKQAVGYGASGAGVAVMVAGAVGVAVKLRKNRAMTARL